VTLADWKSAIQQAGSLRYFRLCGFAVPCFKIRHFAQNSESKKLAELLAKYKASIFAKRMECAGIPALSWRLLQPKPSHKAYPKRRNAAHSKRFASLVATQPP
jgi:hypothetical protein